MPQPGNDAQSVLPVVVEDLDLVRVEKSLHSRHLDRSNKSLSSGSPPREFHPYKLSANCTRDVPTALLLAIQTEPVLDAISPSTVKEAAQSLFTRGFTVDFTWRGLVDIARATT